MPMRADDPPALPSLRSGQITAAGPTEFGAARITGTAIWAVSIRPGLGTSDFGFIGDELCLNWLFELDIIWLRRTAPVAELVRSWIPSFAIGANPLEMDEAKLLLGHRLIFPFYVARLTAPGYSGSVNRNSLSGLPWSHAMAIFCHSSALHNSSG
jgi:hypothetical protein